MQSLSDSASLDALRRALLEHYDHVGRVLPWRGEADPYRVLVSEVMLQQTRVETVKKYYGPWLERFPDVVSLATAPEDDVLKAWEGLGYYRRARNLHRAARVVRERANGGFPSDYEGLRALPGIGDYTAGAVASIAFGEVAPAVDGNVRRVLSRLHDVAAPKASWLRSVASDLVDRDRPGDWNQALMELGATVCTPRGPRCPECPVAGWCKAYAAGTVLKRPAPKPKKRVPTVHLVLGVFRCEGRALLVKRPADGLLGGMWAFPEVALTEGDGRAGRDPGPIRRSAKARPQSSPQVAALGALALSLGLSPIGDHQPLVPCEHRFTHKLAVYTPWIVEVARAVPLARSGWFDPNQARDLALPVAQRRVLESWITSLGPETIA